MKQTHYQSSFIQTSLVLCAVLVGTCIAPYSVFAQTKQGPQKPSDIEKVVKETFKDAPVMIYIAGCESEYRQFYDSGNVFRGSSKYIGVFQIDETLHRNTASAIGFNIYTVEGNLGYARHLYTTSGSKPWLNCSKKYFETLPQQETIEQPPLAQALVASVETISTEQEILPPLKPFPITKNLSLKTNDPEVRELQKILNDNGYPIAQSGAGSKGNETTFFGELTKKAVEKFQCDNAIACAGDSGFGHVGVRTRARLQTLWK